MQDTSALLLGGLIGARLRDNQACLVCAVGMAGSVAHASSVQTQMYHRVWSRRATFRRRGRMISELSRSFLLKSEPCWSWPYTTLWIDPGSRVACCFCYVYTIPEEPSEPWYLTLVHYAVLRQPQSWLAQGDLTLSEDDYSVFTVARHTVAEERHSSVFTSSICAQQHMVEPGSLRARVRTARVGECCPDGPHLPRVPAFGHLLSCTQSGRERSQPF